jgi:amino acid adenylation domain-containing protein
MLGVLKAGGAYLPLDPKLPPARLALLLDQGKPALVLSCEPSAPLLPSGTPIVLLDRHGAEIAGCPTTAADSAVRPEHLAYVLFTSGSTGTPKGVSIEHRQLSAYVDAVTTRLDLSTTSQFATVTTFAADLGNTAIFPAWATGGCVHIISDERAQDPASCAAYFDQHRIEVLKIVPAHLRALLSGSRPERVLPTARLVLGGEACTWDLVDAVHRLAPSCRVFNHYGPTETTVGATVYEVPFEGPRQETATVPIGMALDHACVFVVDSGRQLVPLWTAGELCIGGAGVGRGYLGGGQASQDKFVDNPWGSAGSRMYRTGDRVRMLPDGNLEFLGRIDDQVKIRGFRVEPGEVAAVLNTHPDVEQAAVLPYDSGTGVSLAAFLVPRNGRRAAPGDFRLFLDQRGIPDYMVPSTFVGVDALPMTANGKIDRRQLLTLLERQAPPAAAEEPLTAWERTVADIWRKFLEVEVITPQDNFYDLGGHSLLAIQVVTALERQAQVQISPRDLVFHTLKQFAALCESKRAVKADA